MLEHASEAFEGDRYVVLVVVEPEGSVLKYASQAKPSQAKPLEVTAAASTTPPRSKAEAVHWNARAKP
jgi:hypothetical protein